MTRLPQPLSVTGVVTHDPASRTLSVKPAETGLGWLIWQVGHRAMMEDAGVNGPPAVFARVAGKGDIGRRGEPVRDGWLRFALDDADYRALARPDVHAILTVDKQAGHILAVRLIG